MGVILETLEKEGLDDDTFVIFVNDNGGKEPSENEPFRGGKKDLYEGGIRVPFAMRWPGHLPEGVRYDRPVIQLDVFPTVLAAAGATLPGDRDYDGVNLLPFLRGENPDPPHDRLFWRFVDKRTTPRAVRAGSLKLIVVPGTGGGPERVELFDLSDDPAEASDLASARPRDVRRLREYLEGWERRVDAPDQYGELAPGRARRDPPPES